jgi:DNA-binding NarL/FixJ family response regulator
MDLGQPDDPQQDLSGDRASRFIIEQRFEAIRCLLDGRLFLSGPLSDRLLRHALAQGPSAARSPIHRISDRELQVFRLIGEGLTTAAIADEMSLSVHTIETYRQRIKAKLDLETSAELARAAAHWVLENN